MADARIQASADRVKTALRQYGDRLTRYALPMALTRTAQDAKLAVRRALPEIFDRPTPYTFLRASGQPAYIVAVSATNAITRWTDSPVIIVPSDNNITAAVTGGGFRCAYIKNWCQRVVRRSAR